MAKSKRTPVHGWLILDKPRGLGSNQGVSAVKRVLRQNGYAKTKVGHGGTLDPLAEGVLPIALGEATKLAGRMLDASKVYTAGSKVSYKGAVYQAKWWTQGDDPAKGGPWALVTTARGLPPKGRSVKTSTVVKWRFMISNLACRARLAA